MRFYACSACGNPRFHTSWYKISYDTRAKNVFLTSVITSLAFRLVLQTHTRQKTFHRTRSVIYVLFYINTLTDVTSFPITTYCVVFIATASWSVFAMCTLNAIFTPLTSFADFYTPYCLYIWKQQLLNERKN